MTDGAERYLALNGLLGGAVDAARFLTLPEEIQVRLLQRWIDRTGNEGPAELGKVEALREAIEAMGAGATRRRTLAGALLSLGKGRLSIEAAPPRRSHR